MMMMDDGDDNGYMEWMKNGVSCEEKNAYAHKLWPRKREEKNKTQQHKENKCNEVETKGVK